MLNDFLVSFKVKNSYTVNQFIYTLQKIPFLGKLVSSNLYKNRDLKILNIIISVIREFFKIFVFKLLYIGVFFLLPISLLKNNGQEDLFLHIYFFLASTGAFVNTEIFKPTKEKYYLLVLMKMNARNHTLTNFIYFLASTFLGQLFSIIILAGNYISLVHSLLLVTITLFLKFIAINIYLHRMKKTKTVINENKPSSWTMYLLLLVVGLFLAYGLPYFNIILSSYILYGIAAIVILLGLYSLHKVFTYDKYSYLYKKMLIKDNVILSNEKKSKIVSEASRKKISVDKNITSNKEGFSYFHELFVKRHKKLLKNRAKNITIVIITITCIAIAGIHILPEYKLKTGEFILSFLPYMLLIMYFINTGDSLTNAMFMNCDHSMLTYRFYRQPDHIVTLFKERLKTLITINFIPTITLSLSLCILLFISQRSDYLLNYVIIILSLISMLLFFSTHNLVIYYLLQPYTIGLEMKGVTYMVVNMVTYFLCYYVSSLKVSITLFGILMILFATVYSLISIVLVYKLAPKTFKLK